MITQTQPKARFLYLDSIRALAAIYVVMHHASLQYYKFGDTGLSGFKKYFVKFFSYGHLSVDIFIVLSGFSLMIAVINNNYVLKGGNMAFFKRRFLRIVPPYYATIILCLLLIKLVIGGNTSTLWGMTIPVTKWDIASHFLMVHDIFNSSGLRINYSLWSISVEYRIYFLFPIFIILWKKMGPIITLAISVLYTIFGTLLLIFINNYYNNIGLIFSGVCPYIILFTLGMIAADISLSQSKMANKVRKFYNHLSVQKILIFLIIYIAGYQSLSMLTKGVGISSEYEFFISLEIKDISVGIFAAIFLTICAVSIKTDKSIPWIFRFLNWKPLVFVGTFSYSLYLIHPPLIQLLSKYILAPFNLQTYTNTYLLILVGTPVCIAVSYLFFLLFERPFLNLGAQKSRLAVANKTSTDPAP